MKIRRFLYFIFWNIISISCQHSERNLPGFFIDVDVTSKISKTYASVKKMKNSKLKLKNVIAITIASCICSLSDFVGLALVSAVPATSLIRSRVIVVWVEDDKGPCAGKIRSE